MKKGQTAFELLTTYGWVLLTTLVIAGTLAFLNFTKPEIFIQEECSVSSEFFCKEYGLFEGSDNSTVLLLLRNRNEESLTNKSRILCSFGNSTVEQYLSNESISPGELSEVVCVGEKQNWKPEDKIKINFKIVYYFDTTGIGIARTANGYVYAEVK